MPPPGPRLSERRSAARPLILGHRGAAADAPENTLAAFRLALAQGADGVELDAWRCGSGEVVVIHDEDARRVAGAPLRIAEAPLGALRELDVGAWKGERFRGERLPLLAEVLEALPGARVNVELKGADGRVAAATAEVIRRAGAADRVLVSSFHAGLLAAFRRAAPEVHLGFLFDGAHAWRLRAALARAWLRPAALHPEAALVTAARVERWHRMGLGVNVWTVDEEAEVRRLVRAGVEAIITNAPGRVVGWVEGTRAEAAPASWSHPPKRPRPPRPPR
jgi:glycerophosphoryl diester phosphodiesterase